MVVKKRFRSVFILVAFYALAGASIFYFVTEAQTGNRGVVTKNVLQSEIEKLNTELATLQAEKAVYDHRNKLLSLNSLDGDLLDEQMRAILNRVHPNDVVILQGR